MVWSSRRTRRGRSERTAICQAFLFLSPQLSNICTRQLCHLRRHAPSLSAPRRKSAWPCIAGNKLYIIAFALASLQCPIRDGAVDQTVRPLAGMLGLMGHAHDSSARAGCAIVLGSEDPDEAVDRSWFGSYGTPAGIIVETVSKGYQQRKGQWVQKWQVLSQAHGIHRRKCEPPLVRLPDGLLRIGGVQRFRVCQGFSTVRASPDM